MYKLLFHMSTCFCACVFSCVLAHAMKYSVWDRGVGRSSTGWSVVELPICDFKAHLMDADLAPCSLSGPFRIYQLRDVSWFGSLSLLHFLLVEQSSRVDLVPLQSIVICLGSVEAKLGAEQHGQEWDNRRQQLNRQRGKWAPESDLGLSVL